MDVQIHQGIKRVGVQTLNLLLPYIKIPIILLWCLTVIKYVEIQPSAWEEKMKTENNNMYYKGPQNKKLIRLKMINA